MFEQVDKLKELEKNEAYIYVALVGIGKMGKSLLDRLLAMDGFRPRLIVSRNIEKIAKSLEDLAISKENIVHIKSAKEVDMLGPDQIAISTDIDHAVQAQSIHCLVEATGDSYYGAEVAYKTIQARKDIVMINVEADATVGPSLYKLAQQKGVIYTASAGDEPGAIIELLDFAYKSDFEVIACGKGKNNPKQTHARLVDVEARAKAQNLSPRALLSFVDASNTMIELNTVANATGFLPDVYGCHGIDSDLDGLATKLKLREDGGMLSKYRVLDYVNGIAPGVFVAIKAKTKQSAEILQYTGMGPGPVYILYRPYHLCSLETPSTIYKAVVEGRAQLVPRYGQVCDVVAHAKRDISPGQSLSGIGSNEVYGNLTTYQHARSKDYLPIGLISKSTIARVPIPKDSPISYDMVELDQEARIVKLRKRQDEDHV